MDAKRIDAVIHAVASATSRRIALGGALGVGIANLLARFEGDDAAARKKRRKRNKKCTGGKTTCGKACVNLATSGAHCGQCGNACVSGACLNGFCACSGPDDCSNLNGCVCALAVDGNLVCADRDLTAKECENDAACGPRGVCRQTLGGNVCGTACSG